MVKVSGVQPAAVLPMNPEAADSEGEVNALVIVFPEGGDPGP